MLSLNDIYEDVVGTANKDQNQHYPPRIFDQHFNLASDALLDELVKLYPTNRSVISILKPFMVKKEIRVENGAIKLPANYRNFLSMGVYVRDAEIIPGSDKTEITPCLQNGLKLDEVEEVTVSDIKLKALARTLRSNPVDEKSINEWDLSTGHAYKKPTIENPICCIFEGEEIAIAPYNVEEVVLRYVKVPKKYKFGYIDLPDGTFQFDQSLSVDSEWDKTAHQYLYKAVSSLYSIFARDGEMKEGINELKRFNFF